MQPSKYAKNYGESMCHTYVEMRYGCYQLQIRVKNELQLCYLLTLEFQPSLKSRDPIALSMSIKLLFSNFTEFILHFYIIPK